MKRWGNSIGLRIPAAFLGELGLGENSTVHLTIEDGKLIVAPRSRSAWKYSLQELMSGITEENMHPETEWGPPTGDEA